MKATNSFDVIIVGGSYSGLAAAMALGRSLKNVLIIDSGKPCNRQTPHSHNFLTQDGVTPQEIASIAKSQVARYETVQFLNGLATSGIKTETGFEIQVESGELFRSKKIIFATGIHDIMPELPGYAECWGITVIHCPYCHGYEVRNRKTGILSNGEAGVEYATLISNWTKDLTLYTNGKSNLDNDQTQKLIRNNIKIVEAEIEALKHDRGRLQSIVFKDGSETTIEALYSRPAFVQNCLIPEALGCELTEEGFIKADAMQKTNIPGVYACGDNVSRMRAVANAVSMGTMAGVVANREIIWEDFL